MEVKAPKVSEPNLNLAGPLCNREYECHDTTKQCMADVSLCHSQLQQKS